MNRRRSLTSIKTASIAGIVALTFALGACSTDEATDEASSASETMSSMAESSADTSAESSSEEATPAENAGPVGPGCQAYADAHPDGPASLGELENKNIADAIADIPELKTLTSALTGGLNPEVNLADVLRDGEFTVFAPTEEAFGKIDAATIEQLKQDPELLKGILTYHVVEGQAAPADAVGIHTTVNGADLEVTQEGEAIKVNGNDIVCGGIELENATVYLINDVLMPPEEN